MDNIKLLNKLNKYHNFQLNIKLKAIKEAIISYYSKLQLIDKQYTYKQDKIISLVDDMAKINSFCDEIRRSNNTLLKYGLQTLLAEEEDVIDALLDKQLYNFQSVEAYIIEVIEKELKYNKTQLLGFDITTHDIASWRQLLSVLGAKTEVESD